MLALTLSSAVLLACTGGPGGGGTPGDFVLDGSIPSAPEVVVPTSGGTTVHGTLSGHLTEAGSPYRIVGDAENVATVPAGATLTIDPGVILDFVGDPGVTEADSAGDEVMHHQSGRVELRVYGQLTVLGTAEKKVAFTSTNPYGWWGINFFGSASDSADLVLQHLILEKVRKNRHNDTRQFTRGAIWAFLPGRKVTLQGSVFRDNVVTGKCGAIDLMYTVGSVVEGNLFENNATSEIDRFAQEGSTSRAGGGAMCITHGRNTVVRGNAFRGNTLESFRGYSTASLAPRGFTQWPNDNGTYDLGGGGALHYFQPDNDLIEGNLFEGNAAKLGHGAALYFEDVATRGVTVRNNQFKDNLAEHGGVVVCHRGNGSPAVVMEGNAFSGNRLGSAAAPDFGGSCNR